MACWCACGPPSVTRLCNRHYQAVWAFSLVPRMPKKPHMGMWSRCGSTGELVGRRWLQQESGGASWSQSTGPVEMGRSARLHTSACHVVSVLLHPKRFNFMHVRGQSQRLRRARSAEACSPLQIHIWNYRNYMSGNYVGTSHTCYYKKKKSDYFPLAPSKKCAFVACRCSQIWC